MRPIYACLLFAIAAPSAQAAFYVSDTPTPTAPVVAAAPYLAQSAASNAPDASVYKVPFAARSTQLSLAAKRALMRILPVAQSVPQVVVSGCGDGGSNDVTAYRRGAEIKAWLLDNGIAHDAIVIKTGADAGTIKVGGTYQCLVSFVDSASPGQKILPPAPALQTVVQVATAAPARAEVVGQTAQPDPRLWMMQNVIEMVASKALKADDAIMLLDRIMKTSAVAAPAPVPAPAPALAPQPTMMQVAAAPALQVVPVPPRQWVMKAGTTLQAALEEWSRQAGWKPLVWRASNPYQISTGATLQGDFVDVLRQISKAVPQLDMTVSTDTKTLTVKDGTI
ncbi:TcpQ domain-containing protein [Ralstonia thomasii]|uniref:TcpQ domain-containing protein n=1 Tax=Ralstonia thomasii TaxID=3058596 RepID=UPI003C2C60B8